MPIADFKLDTATVPEPSCVLERSIWSWANIYKVSFSIFALNELGVLKLVAAHPLTAGQIAGRELEDAVLLQGIPERVNLLEHEHRAPAPGAQNHEDGAEKYPLRVHR